MDRKITVTVLILILVLAFLGPLATIFSVNALFGTTWAYSFTNWFAVLWLQSALYSIGRAVKK